MSLLIQNGTIVTVAERRAADVRCHDGRIVEVGRGLEPTAGEERLDAGGQLIFPGGVDPHVHLELAVAGTVSADDFESGTAAGLAGGTTTVIDFVHPEKGENWLDALADRRQAAAKAVADYGLHMAATWWGDPTGAWMERCVRQEGIPSFKVYMAYKETVGVDDTTLIRILDRAAALGARTLVHAEHGEIIEHLRNRLAAEEQSRPWHHALSRPPIAEGEATARAAMLAAVTKASLYVVHVTSDEAVAALARARERGAPVTGETCPQYLLLDDSVYSRRNFEGAAYVVSPPIRPQGHQEVLWSALREGLLQVVGTDHCPFTMAQKEAGRDDFRLIPGGAAGVEHRLALLYTYGVLQDRIDLHQFVDLVSTRPAKLFGLYPRKGTIAPGADADLVIWDPEATGVISAATHRHRCDRSIYEGLETKGGPSTVITGGRIRFLDGDLRVERGVGRYLERQLG